MELISALASAWEQRIARAGPPKRQVISLAGLPAVGKSTCLHSLRSRKVGALVIDEREFLTKEDLQRAAEADERLSLVPANEGLVEQKNIYVAAEKRRCELVLRQIGSPKWGMLCGGVESTVMVLEMLAHRGLIDITWERAMEYGAFADVRSSAAILLVASPKVLKDRLRTRMSIAGRGEDRSAFVELVSEVYLPWYERVVPRVVPLDTTDLSPEDVAQQVHALVAALTSDGVTAKASTP